MQINSWDRVRPLSVNFPRASRHKKEQPSTIQILQPWKFSLLTFHDSLKDEREKRWAQRYEHGSRGGQDNGAALL
jgi:hypothetical protein